MELLSIDTFREGPKNWHMTDAERKSIGRKLRALRIERGLDQIPAAEKAGLSVGTLQSIETPKKHPDGRLVEVRDSNVEKYAAIFGTTVKKLLRPEGELSPTDPRLVDLNDEHLDIARRFAFGRRLPREAVEVLLSHPPAEEVLAKLLLRLATLPPERVHELDRWLHVAPHLLPLIEQVWRRMLMDPAYVDLQQENVAVLARHPIPTSPTRRKPSSTPKRRA